MLTLFYLVMVLSVTLLAYKLLSERIQERRVAMTISVIAGIVWPICLLCVGLYVLLMTAVKKP